MDLCRGLDALMSQTSAPTFNPRDAVRATRHTGKSPILEFARELAPNSSRSSLGGRERHQPLRTPCSLAMAMAAR